MISAREVESLRSTVVRLSFLLAAFDCFIQAHKMVLGEGLKPPTSCV